MTRPLVIIRPEPGSSQTAALAADKGLTAHCFPLFNAFALPWDAPESARYTGVIMTSASAARFAGSKLADYLHLPLYAVGDVTAAAAKDAGFGSVVSGDGDVNRLLGKVATLGHHRMLHIAGADFHPYEPHGLEIDRVAVYKAELLPPPAALDDMLREHAVVLLHSPRAAAQFAKHVDEREIDRSTIAIIAISANAAAAAGQGWQKIVVSVYPRDDALVQAATTLY